MTKTQNINLRTCIITNQKLSKEFLIRIVRDKNNNIFVNNFIQGRGIYVSKNLKSYEDINKKKLLNKKFKMPIDNKIYDYVLKEIEVQNAKEKR